MTLLALLLFFLSGAAALIYEVLWARQLGLVFGATAGAAAHHPLARLDEP